MVFTVVLGQLVFRAVEREPRLPDAVSIPADEGAEIRWRGIAQISVKRVEPEHHVVQLAGAVRNAQRNQNPAVRHDSRFGALAVGQRVELNRLAAAGGAKGPALRTHILRALFVRRRTRHEKNGCHSDRG